MSENSNALVSAKTKALVSTKTKAVAYLRTSSPGNVGSEKDSDKRQMAAITEYARRARCEIVLPPYYDAAISGADPIDKRPGFQRMLAFLADNPDVRTILVENAERFARGTLVQELGFEMLKESGIVLISVADPAQFVADTPEAVLIRHIRGAISQFEKSTIVSKLRMARMRKRATGVKVEGRKSHAEVNPNAVAMARRLHHKDRLTGKRKSYRDIAAAMAESGHVATSGKPYGPSAVMSMLTR